MKPLRFWLARLRALVHSLRGDRDLHDELESHLAMHTADNVRAGMPPEEARRQALIALGGIEQTKERYRDQRRLQPLDEVRQDVRFGLRMMSANPGFTIVTVMTLALGIAANNFVFSIVNAVLLRPLPFERPDRLLSVRTINPNNQEQGVSYLDFVDLRERVRSFTALAAYRGEAGLNVSEEERAPERVMGSYVSANAFHTLGKAPVLGRDFRHEDDRAGAPGVAIVGHRLWMSRYGGEQSILGRSIRVNGMPTTVIGVMPSAMEFPQSSQIWLPLAPASAGESRDARRVQVFGRLTDGSGREEARAELDAVAAHLAVDYPKTNEGIRPIVRTLRPGIGWQWTVIFSAMMGAVGFVLLIACANIANLLLARSARRSYEMSLRMSLGASRGRLVRQLLIETLLLGALAGVLAIALAMAALRSFVLFITQMSPPYWMQFSLDARTFVFFTVISVGTGVLAGLVPAFRASRTEAMHALKANARSATSESSRRLTMTLVTAELVLTLILLTGAAAMMRRSLDASRVDAAIDTPELLTMRVQLPARSYPSPEHRVAYVERLDAGLSEIPGIGMFSVTNGLPVSPGGIKRRLHDVQASADVARLPQITTVSIGSRYFDTLRLPLLRGRDFDDRDGLPGHDSVIVNGRFAELYFPAADPIGKHIRLSDTSPNARPTIMTIVGVSPIVRQEFEVDIAPVAYLPYRSNPTSSVSVIVRSSIPAAVLTARIREAVRRIDADLPLADVLRMDQVVTQMLWATRVLGGLFAIFAAMAFVLSAVGLYGVTAYTVNQRTREIGVRMALGAHPQQVWWIVLRRTIVQLAVGLVLGIGGVAVIAPLLQGLLVGSYATDAGTVGFISVVFVVVSLAASFLPARRATKLPPSAALRYE